MAQRRLVARTARLERAGAWHHVTARGSERRAIYRDDRDRQHFCGLLGQAVGLFHWRLHAYVLMDNHYHLLVETPEPNLGRGMQWLNTSYCVWFNRRHQRVGHLLQGRFKSIVVDPSGWALEVSRYLHLNPVRVAALGLGKTDRRRDAAGVGARPAGAEVRARLERLRGYRWSSWRAYGGWDETPPWLWRQTILSLGGGRGEEAIQNYRRYVEDAVRQGLPASPWEQLRDRTVLGGVEFARRLAKGLGLGATRGPGARKWTPPPVEEIIAVVEEAKGERWNDFRDRHGDWGRDLVFHLGRTGWAIPLRALAKAAGNMDEVAVSVAARRVPARAKKHPGLAKALQACRVKLQMSNV